MSENTGIKVFGADWCIDCRNAKAAFAEAGVAYEYIDLVADESAAKVAEDISGKKRIPVVVYPDGTFQSEPSKQDIHAKLQDLGITA